MRKKRAKGILKLVVEKDPNLLKTIKRERGEIAFKGMTGIAIYRNAKKLYRKYEREDKWGYGTNN